MKIIDTINCQPMFISLEFFPPKAREEWPSFFRTVERLAVLKPLFVSVTYGAGGSANAESLEIVTRLQNDFGFETMAHLTCVGASTEETVEFLQKLDQANVGNVLALRGDMPQNAQTAPVDSPLRYASDLVSLIATSFPSFGVGVAGYPEIHPEAVNLESDLSFLKLKLDNGGDFVITQLFFDNNLYYDFVRRSREAGITQPIIPGILPVVSLKVIKRIVSLCGASIPPAFMAELELADQTGGAAAVQKVGVAHARKQLQDLLDSGVPGIHLYTLNRAEVVFDMLEGIIDIE